jgi:hypothetical protein
MALTMRPIMGPLHPPHERPLGRAGCEGGEGRPRLDVGTRPSPGCEGDDSRICVCRDPKPPGDGPGLCECAESETEIFGGEKATEPESAETEITGAPCSETEILGASEIEITGVSGAETEILGPLPGPDTTILGSGASSSTLLSSWCPFGSHIFGSTVCPSRVGDFTGG